MCRIITVANQKGGVGKSSTALNLGYALGQQGKKVALLDLDPQASLTVCFGVENHERLETTICTLIDSVLKDEELPPKDSYTVSKGNVDLIPCNIALSAAEERMREEIGSEKTVSYILDQIKDDYDVVIIDTAPTLGFLTLNALAASDSVIITVSPQFLSAIGLKLLLKTIEKVRKRINSGLKIEGILMTMCDSRTNLYKEICEAVNSAYGGSVNIFDTQIPNSVKVGEANMKCMSIIEYMPKNSASTAYTKFAEEVMPNG